MVKMLAFFAILVFFYTVNDKNKMNKENILKLVLLPNITIIRFSGFPWSICNSFIIFSATRNPLGLLII